MKNRLLFFGSFCFAMHFVSAQDNGIYMNAYDFSEGKLSYFFECGTAKNKSKLNEFWEKDYLTVVYDNEPHEIKKNEIFGYRDCDSLAYRFVGDNHYLILNPSERILLYKYESPASKKLNEDPHYFFTHGATGEMKTLTLTNLKAEFPENYKFHDSLDAEFKSDSELLLFDILHKEYKINWLYTAIIL